MKKKSRLEVLRGKIARAGLRVTIRDDMPEEIAESFLGEMRLCLDCAAAGAAQWSPGRKGGVVITAAAGPDASSTVPDEETTIH